MRFGESTHQCLRSKFTLCTFYPRAAGQRNIKRNLSWGADGSATIRRDHVVRTNIVLASALAQASDGAACPTNTDAAQAFAIAPRVCARAEATNRTPVRDRLGALGSRRGSLYR